jgi:ferrous iron transport protein A
MPTPSAALALTLDALPPGSTAVVEGVGGGPGGASAIEQRLRDLGLVPGTTVRVLRRAPLGDPTEYELRGYRLCLRRTEAARVRVRDAAERVAVQDEDGG